MAHSDTLTESDSGDTERIRFELGSLCELLIDEAEQYARGGQLAYAMSTLERASQFTDFSDTGDGSHKTFESAVCRAYDSFFAKNTYCRPGSPAESEIVEARCVLARIFGSDLPQGIADRVGAAYTLLQRRSNPHMAVSSSADFDDRLSLPEDFVDPPAVPDHVILKGHNVRYKQ
jgi:hypothetical protein